MQRTIRAKFTNGHIVPAEPLDIEEGEDLLVTVEESTHDSVEAEDAALARAIDEGLKSKVVGREQVIRPITTPTAACTPSPPYRGTWSAFPTQSSPSTAV